MEARFIIIDENRSRDMHGINEYQAVCNSALFQTLFDLGRNINKCTPARNVEPEFLSICFHDNTSFGLFMRSSQNKKPDPSCIYTLFSLTKRAKNSKDLSKVFSASAGKQQAGSSRLFKW
jgi:hypothetical protein